MVKKILSTVLSITTAASLLTSFPATAESTTKTPYSLSEGITKLKSNLSTKNDYLKAKSLLADYRKAVSDYQDTEEQLANTSNPIKKIRLQFELEKQEKVVYECAFEVASSLGINSDNPNELQLSISTMLSGHLDTKWGEFDYSFNNYFDWFFEIEPETTDDSDGDGLTDELESEIGTDIYSADTDGDSLTDYEEFKLTGTDPTVFDSVTEGISDAEIDMDEDGLSNAVEVEIGTDPRKTDTDSDNLNDGDELTYGTDPLNPDTDGDTILDGDEEEIGFDPTKFDTDGNGVSDGDEYVIQTVRTDRFSDDIFEDNIAIPSITDASAKGNINSRIEVEEYTGYLKGGERSYVGKVIEVKNSDLQSGKISFTLSDEYSIKDYEVADTSTNGLLICYNDNEETTPLETEFDPETRTLSAEITSDGIYFVLDVIDWMNSLGIDLDAPEEEDEAEEATTTTTTTTSATTTSVTTTTIVEEKEDDVVKKDSAIKRAPLRASKDGEPRIADIKIRGQVDIVFVVDTTGSMGSHIANVKNNLTAFVDDLKNAGITPNFALVKYEDITWDGLDSTQTTKNGTSNWFSDTEKFKQAISDLRLGDGGDLPETAIDGLEMARQLDMRSSAQKFVILVTDADYKVNNNYGIESMTQIANTFKSDNISVSVVTRPSVKSRYEELYNTTNGIYANLDGNFKDELLTIADKIDKTTNDGCWIALDGLIPQIVKLDENPSPTSDADTDKDTLLDRKELKSTTPTKYQDLSIYIVLLGIKGVTKYILPVYEYYSNPANEDSDNDGILDPKDTQKLTKNNYPRSIVNYINDDVILMTSIRETNDDFIICTTPLSEILKNAPAGSINGLVDNDGDTLSVDGYYDDWYLMVLNKSDAVYGLFKMREQENDSDDNNDPGVTISFVRFHISKLNDVLYNSGTSTNDLFNEIQNTVATSGQAYSDDLQNYFVNVNSDGAYFIADAYIEKIASTASMGKIAFPDKLNEIYSQLAEIDNTINMVSNSLFPDYNTLAVLYRQRGKVARVPDALEDINNKAGKTIVDVNNKTIYISNPSNLDYYEKIAILAAFTADISYNMFAAEAQAHADWVDDFTGKISSSWYNSALRADMAIGEDEEYFVSWVTSEFYDPNGHWVKDQANAHGEY